MKVRKYLALSICSLALLSVFGCSSNSPVTTAGHERGTISPPKPAPLGNRYIVTLKANVNKSVREFVEGLLSVNLKDFSARPVYFYEQIKAFALEVPNQTPEEVENTLIRIEGVEHVGRDHLIRIEESASSWGLDRIDQRDPQLDGNYNSMSTGRGVNVYVVDTGIYITHHDFSGRASVAYDAVDDDDNKYTPSNTDRNGLADGLDCHGHGTHVAGTVGGEKYGVAKETTIFSVRVIGRNENNQIVGPGCGGYGLATEILDGIDWITANHQKLGKPSVVNLSIGGDYDSDFNSAVQRSIAAGITYVAAAGNDKKDLSGNSPASAKGIIPVGASELRQEISGRWIDYRWPDSNYGVNIIFAPGVSIKSAGYHYDDDYAIKEGTSMAAPHVAGIAALYLQNHPGSSPALVMKVIEDNATRDIVSEPGPGSRNLLVYSGFL
jgi:subtilisin family serine protease